jgi:enoyl-CoA hydratase/carnithine racemase
MAVVELESHGTVLVIRMNRPERLNAMGAELLTALAHAWTEFRDDSAHQVAILTGVAGSFCVGEDLKESAARGTSGFAPNLPFDPFWNDGRGPAESIGKPIIAAVNGWAMGGGFIYAWMCDLKVASRNAIFEISEARVFSVGAYEFAFTDFLAWSTATELALGYQLSADRMHQLGFVNRVVDDEGDVVSAALELAEHLLRLPPTSLRNTLEVCRRLRPALPPDVAALVAGWRGVTGDPYAAEARRAFLEKRPPDYKGFVSGP